MGCKERGLGQLAFPGAVKGSRERGQKEQAF